MRLRGWDKMDGIALMVEEHVLIKRMLQVMRKACLSILHGGSLDHEDFEKMIDFVRNYADKHHHGKEEQILFNRMTEEIGGAAEKLVRYGMLVEHDMGRLYMMDLVEALSRVQDGEEEAKLDVIAHAISYTHLLHRHIHKEDHIAYPFAKQKLAPETLHTIDQACEAFEIKMEEKGVQKKYLALVESLEEKYQV